MNLHAPLLLQAASAACAGQTHPASALYVVATPIGNLADITLRAIHVLALADTVACEDTRMTARLLQHLGLHKPLLALHEHNEEAGSGQVIALLAQGQRVAYVSDAGTPAVSDPGAVLVARVRGAGLRVLPLPGASSVLTALSAAGDARGTGFVFAGFLPAKGSERDAALAAALADPRTQVLLEAPHRIEALLQALAAQAPQRSVSVARELTKQFETVVTRPAAELPGWIAADEQQRRGEFVLVLHALAPVAADDDALPAASEQMLKVLLAELPLKQAVALAAQISGAPRNALYARALALKAG